MRYNKLFMDAQLKLPSDLFVIWTKIKYTFQRNYSHFKYCVKGTFNCLLKAFIDGLMLNDRFYKPAVIEQHNLASTNTSSFTDYS